MASSALAGTIEIASGRTLISTSLPSGMPSCATWATSPDVEADPAVGFDPSAEQVGRADEVGDEPGRRALVELLGRPELLDLARVHHRDPVAHRERLLLIVGHVHEGDPDLRLDALELDLELATQLEVEGAERLVEEQHVGPVDQRPGEGDPLLLAARQLVRLAAFVAGQVDELERFTDPARGLVLGDALALQAERDVVADVEVGEERVVLEDHVDRALVGRIGGHVATTQQDRPAGRELEAADHPQRGRLAAARRTEQREEFAGGDLERDAVDRPDLAESLLQVEELDLRGRRDRRGRHRDAEANGR